MRIRRNNLRRAWGKPCAGAKPVILYGVPYLSGRKVFIMNTDRKSYLFEAVLIVLAVVVIAFFSITRFPVVDAASGTYSPVHYFAGSDCIADKAIGDFYPRGQNSSHCEVGAGDAAPEHESWHYERITRPVVTTSTHAEKNTTVVVVVTTAVVTVDAPVVVVTSTCTNANPGNKKCKGHAGEDPNGKGTMPLDSGSLTGNGEHGNQGTNTNGAEHGNSHKK